MEKKMTKEQGKKIKDLKEEIQSLQKQINQKELEIDSVLVEAASNFEDSYVEFYNGEEYVFMKVERQYVRDGGAKINLQAQQSGLTTALSTKIMTSVMGLAWFPTTSLTVSLSDPRFYKDLPLSGFGKLNVRI